MTQPREILEINWPGYDAGAQKENELTEKQQTPECALDALKDQQSRLMAGINAAEDHRGRIEFERQLTRCLVEIAKIEEHNNQQTEQQKLERAVRGQIASLSAFLINQLDEYPNARNALLQALYSEYGINIDID